MTMTTVRRALEDPAVLLSLRRYLTRICRDPHLAEDLAQDAAIRAIEQAHHFRGDGSVDGWLRAIARTTFLMAVRARRESPVREIDDAAPSAEEVALDRWERRRAAEALRDLPGDDRELIDLYYGLDLPLHRIAVLTASTRDGVKCRLYRLRRRLAGSPPVRALDPRPPARSATAGEPAPRAAA